MDGQEISTKYAVYTNKSGADVLDVVVDTPEQAKVEMERLKATNPKGHIAKAQVMNFGKPDEKTQQSEVIEKWESNGQPQNLSGAQQTPEVVPVVAPVPIPVEPVVDEKKMFEDYYALNGSLIGGSYRLPECEKKEDAPKLETGGDTNKSVLDKMTNDLQSKLSLVKLLDNNKINGFGVKGKNGKYFIEVTADKISEELTKELPKEIDGIEVRVIEQLKQIEKVEPVKIETPAI